MMFEYSYGVHLKNSTIWFDAFRKKKLSFITDALSTNFLRHEKVITTPQTYKLLKRRFANVDVLPCPYNHEFNLGEIEVELLPSGFILGSSQVLMYKDNKKILYVGDFKLDLLKTSKPVEITQCDILVIKSSFGKKNYVFPSVEVAINPIVDFVNDSLERELIPILLAQRLGNSQELVYILGDIGFDLYVHSSIHSINKIYEDCGFSFPKYKLLSDVNEMLSGVVIIPEEYRTDIKLSFPENVVYASLSEMAIDKDFDNSARSVNFSYPFSIRSGYDEMLKFVELVNPVDIYVTGDYNSEFSESLRSKGYNSSALNNPEQLELI